MSSVMSSNADREKYATYDNLDRAVSISFRPLGRSRGAMAALYEFVRSENPISYEIARGIIDHPGSKVGILTGAAVPDHLPKGENDGPLGSMVLGKALQELGYKVAFLTDVELTDIFDVLFKIYGREFEMILLDKNDSQDQAQIALDLDMLIGIERLGANARHVMHGATGTSRNGTRANVDGLVRRMNAAGKVTVGIGDGGNEIGFGKIYKQAREIVDFGKSCRCPCQDGIITITPTQFLYPVAVSNWGAYAVTAALAALTSKFQILHSPERELELLALATSIDCRDGGTGIARDYVDGVPGKTSAAVVQIIKTLAETVEERRERAF